MFLAFSLPAGSFMHIFLHNDVTLDLATWVCLCIVELIQSQMHFIKLIF